MRRKLASENEKKLFVAKTDYYQEKIKGKPERDQKLMLQKIADDNISYSPADDKKIKFDTISFSVV